MQGVNQSIIFGVARLAYEKNIFFLSFSDSSNRKLKLLPRPQGWSSKKEVTPN